MKHDVFVCPDCGEAYACAIGADTINCDDCAMSIWEAWTGQPCPYLSEAKEILAYCPACLIKKIVNKKLFIR